MYPYLSQLAALIIYLPFLGVVLQPPFPALSIVVQPLFSLSQMTCDPSIRSHHESAFTSYDPCLSLSLVYICSDSSPPCTHQIVRVVCHTVHL